MSCYPCSCLSVRCVFVAGEAGPSSAAEPPTAFHCDWHNHRNGCIMASLQPIPCLGRPGGSSCDKRQHHMCLRAACGEPGEGRDLCISCAVSAGVLPAAQAATVEQRPAEHAATADYSSPTGRLLMALHVERQDATRGANAACVKGPNQHVCAAASASTCLYHCPCQPSCFISTLAPLQARGALEFPWGVSDCASAQPQLHQQRRWPLLLLPCLLQSQLMMPAAALATSQVRAPRCFV